MGLGVGGGQGGFGRHGVGGVGGVPHQGAAGFEIGGHLGAQVLDRLERADRAAELAPLLGIGDRFADRGLTRSQHVGGQHHPTGVTQSGKDVAVGKRFGRRGAEPDLAETAGAVDRGERNNLDPRRVGGEEVQGSILVGDDKDVGPCGVDGEQRGPGQPAGLDADAGPVPRPGDRLADGDSRQDRSSGEPGEPLGLLALRTGPGDGERREDGARQKGGRGDAGPQSLGGKGGLQESKTEAAMLGCDKQARDAKVDERGPDFASDRLIAVGETTDRFERGDTVESAGDRGLHQALVRGQSEIHQAALGSRGRPRPRSAMMFF